MEKGNRFFRTGIVAVCNVVILAGLLLSSAPCSQIIWPVDASITIKDGAITSGIAQTFMVAVDIHICMASITLRNRTILLFPVLFFPKSITSLHYSV